MSFGTNDVTPRAYTPCGESIDEPQEKPGHWIEIELVYENKGEPCVWEEYCIKLPDGSEVRGYLDEHGEARVNFIEEPGNCDISFPKLDGEAWKSA